jgi:hypothetical protein
MFGTIVFEEHAIPVAASRSETLAHRVLRSRDTIAEDFTMGFFAIWISLRAAWMRQNNSRRSS